MDFTIKKYTQLLKALQQAGYFFQTSEDFLQEQQVKTIILRHDVDLSAKNSLCTAKIENELGIKGSYYFRAIPQSWDENIIKQISDLGHEVGYHYENLSVFKGDYNGAIKDFETNLMKLRKLAHVKTICMHGSPMSKFNNLDLWKKYNYKDYGIIGDLDFDINFDEVFYLTETGRRWDGYKVSVRDKIAGKQKEWEKQGLSFHSSLDIIKAAGQGKLPYKIMITVHPQRWHDSKILWAKELVLQNIKNIVKRIFFVTK